MKKLTIFSLTALMSAAPAQAAVPASACAPHERGQMINGELKLPEHYRRMVTYYAHAEGIPERLLTRLVWHESEFCHQARSAVGAIGLMQLMPATARELGVDPYNPHSNMAGGARYLKQLKAQVKTWPLALAAYNAGPGAVQRFGGVPPYPETQRYVLNISRAAGLELNTLTSPGLWNLGDIAGRAPSRTQ